MRLAEQRPAREEVHTHPARRLATRLRLSTAGRVQVDRARETGLVEEACPPVHRRAPLVGQARRTASLALPSDSHTIISSSNISAVATVRSSVSSGTRSRLADGAASLACR